MFWALYEPWRFLSLDVLAVSRGFRGDTRRARTGWISGRGRENCHSLRNVQEKMLRNLSQLKSLLSLLHSVYDLALIKHFGIIQKLLWIIVSQRVMGNCSKLLCILKYQLKNLKCLIAIPKNLILLCLSNNYWGGGWGYQMSNSIIEKNLFFQN